MSVFNEKYASLYESIHAEKNYSQEVNQIQKILAAKSPQVKTILNFGCGTGKHDFLLANLGFEVIGVDRSHEMLKLAKNKQCKENPSFLHTDESDLINNDSIDASLCLFDVFSYFTEDSSILNFFTFIKKKSKKSSLLIFDFWYLPAVVHMKPATRKKSFRTNHSLVTRICEASMDISTSCIDANHEFFVKNEKGIETFAETHRMRCFTKNEIRIILNQMGFELNALGTWSNPDKEPELNDWSVLAIASRID